jgi:hypothetical protein
MITHKSAGDVTEVPDPRDIVRSLLPHVQRRLRHRPKPTKGWIKDRDYNVVDDDITDPKSKQIIRRRERLGKRKRELYVLEAPEETPEVAISLQLFQQEGEIEGVSELEVATAGILPLLKTLLIGRLDHLLNVASVCLADYATSYGFKDAMRLIAMAYPDKPTYRQAINDPERQEWLSAIEAEIRENLEKGTFKFLDEPTEIGHLVDAKWVLKKKYLSNDDLDKYKARICARGFTQREGLDYTETKATTARAAAWRILFALAAVKGWHVHHVDFVAAFLNDNLGEKILMREFPGLAEFFARNPQMAAKFGYSQEGVIKLLKPLYGLKQSAMKWQQKAKMLLAARGFMPLESDDVVYYSQKTGDIVTTHVDDFLIMGQSSQRLKDLTTSLQNDVKLNDLGNADWFLGIKTLRSIPVATIIGTTASAVAQPWPMAICQLKSSLGLAQTLQRVYLQHPLGAVD